MRIFDWLTQRWYNLKYGVRNLWRWAPIIWRDRDWDHGYLSRILEFKLYTMYNYLNSDQTVGLHHKRDLANLARAALAARMLWKLSPDWEPGDEALYVKSLVKSFEQSYLNWWD
jgi:hypothetical protein